MSNTGILGAMTQSSLPKLFRKSEVVKDSVSMLLEKIPPTRDHEGDHQISLVVANGYFDVDLCPLSLENLIRLQHVAEAPNDIYKPNSCIYKTRE